MIAVTIIEATKRIYRYSQCHSIYSISWFIFLAALCSYKLYYLTGYHSYCNRALILLAKGGNSKSHQPMQTEKKSYH